MENAIIGIRSPEISDLEDIVHINRVCLPENYPVAYFIELIRSWRESSVVAEFNNKTVGYVLVRIEKSSFVSWKIKSKAKAHVISVAVLPEARRNGIGREMMKEVIKRVQNDSNINEMTLEVRKSNLSAIKLYEQLNFIVVKDLTNYYSDGEDAYLMSLYFE